MAIEAEMSRHDTPPIYQSRSVFVECHRRTLTASPVVEAIIVVGKTGEDWLYDSRLTRVHAGSPMKRF